MMLSIKHFATTISSITCSLLACLIVNGGSLYSETVANAYCENPAPLKGQFNPDVPGYIVVFKENIDSATEANRLINIYKIQLGFIYSTALNGFSAEMTDDTKEKLRCESSVAYIEYDSQVSIN